MAEGVCQVKDVTLVFENAAACPFYVYTDMPGSAMALRRTIALPITTTRMERTFPLDAAGAGLVDAKMIKYGWAPAGALKLFSGFVRFRRIGEYIDGTLGEIWETQEISLAP